MTDYESYIHLYIIDFNTSLSLFDNTQHYTLNNTTYIIDNVINKAFNISVSAELQFSLDIYKYSIALVYI